MNGRDWDEAAKELGITTGEDNPKRKTLTAKVSPELLRSLWAANSAGVIRRHSDNAANEQEYTDNTVVVWETQDEDGNWIKRYGRVDEDGNVAPIASLEGE